LFPDGRPGELFITMAKEGSTIGGLMDAFGTSVSMSLQYGVPLEDYVRKFSHMRFEPQGYTKNPDIRIAKSLIDYIFRWLGITFLPGYKEASLGVVPGAEPEIDDAAGSTGSTISSASVQDAGGRGQGQGMKPKPPVAEKPGLKADGGRPSTSSSERRKGEGETAILAPSPQSPASKPSNGHTNGHTNGHASSNGHGEISAALLARAGVMLKDSGPNTARSEQFADFQSDAPACDNCGAITVRNGNCYLCHNCGSSMGCS
jgi:ribonucleoside-diphosphate reductase alpha chain